MLLALSGITGVGKSYFAEEIAKKLDFNKVRKNGEIAYDFNVFGGTYAYKSEEIFSKENYVFEMYYTTIQDWKKIRPDIVTIYILPRDVDVALQKVKQRNLTKEKEEERIKETEEQYKEFQNMFDYIIYNNYDYESEENLMNLIRNIKN